MRPNYTKEQCAKEYKDTASKFHEEMDTAGETVKSANDGAFETFKPSSEVSRDFAYSLEVFEEVGLVGESEFLRLTGMTVKEAGLKEKEDSCSIKINGPDGNPSKLWIIGLKGLPFEEVVGMKRARISYKDVASHRQLYLLPQDQLTANQATYVFPHVFNLQSSEKVAGLKLSSSDKIKHATALKQKHEDLYLVFS